MPNTFHSMSSDRNARLAGLFLLGLLVFNFPLANLYGEGRTVLGLPLGYLLFFLIWAAFIFLVFRIVRRRR